jgi:hypothetical protein
MQTLFKVDNSVASDDRIALQQISNRERFQPLNDGLWKTDRGKPGDSDYEKMVQQSSKSWRFIPPNISQIPCWTKLRLVISCPAQMVNFSF